MKKKTKFKQTEIGLIPEDWEVVELGAVADFQYGLGERAKERGDLVYIRITDISSDGFFKKNGLVFIDKEKVGEKYLLKKGDVLVARTGASYGKTYKFNEEFKASYGGFLIKILFKKERLLSDFYFQFSRSKLFWNQAQNLVGGGAQPQFNSNVLSKIVVPCPEIKEQQRISKILSDIDSKIELNLKMNKVLEEIGQAVFKRWFVEFEFPNEEGRPYKSSGGEMVESDLGEIPKGWEAGKLEDIAGIVGGGTPSTKNSAYFSKSGIGWITPKDLSNFEWKFISKGHVNITEEGLRNSSASLMPPGSILFSSRAPIGYIAMAESELSTNQGFKSLVPKQKYYSEYLYYLMKNSAEKIESIASGSTFREVSGSVVKKFEIVIPADSLMKEFQSKITSLSDRMRLLKIETEKLVNIRDSLLPRLMSGKIRLPVGN